MIEARKSPFFSQIFHYYNRRLLKKSFHHLYLNQQTDPIATSPTLYIINHSSWWDGLITFYLTKTVIEQDCYAMMTEQGLTSFPFFRKIGGYSINKDNPKDVIKSLAYTKKLLKLAKGVWIFPQGKEEHLEKRPLLFQSGVSRLITQVPDLTVIPITFYYTFLHDQHPEVFITIGEKLPRSTLDSFSSKQEMTHYLEQVVTDQLDRQKHEIITAQFDQYEILLRGNRTVSEKFQDFFGK
ncbi:MAG: lysophospholipid acyltransferase family protein [Anaerobacillus sp.]|uniref:lysophospholipid acyltransferase family protein n=1 Tax=Anaerobacillus sp. TaxID=1872506 RepID=UPI00391CFD54